MLLVLVTWIIRSYLNYKNLEDLGVTDRDNILVKSSGFDLHEYK